MMNNIDNICIIVCFYNTNPKYLEECFRSIDNAIWMFKRYYSIPVNVHVMDDGTDNIDTINMFGDIVDAEFKYIKWWRHETNTNLSTSINDLNKHTPENSLVIYIDSDDVMLPNRILVQYETFTQDEQWNDITLCCGNTCNINATNDDMMKLYYHINYKIINNINLMQQNIICHPTIAYKINHLRKYNIEYDNNLECAQDFDFYLNILSHNLKILFIPDAVTLWRQYPLEEKPNPNRNYEGALGTIQVKYYNFNLKFY